MRYEPNLYGRVMCPQCGKRFMSDCGPDFCSSYCEEEYSRTHQKCEQCKDEFHEDDLIEKGEERYCENCKDEMEEAEDDEE